MGTDEKVRESIKSNAFTLSLTHPLGLFLPPLQKCPLITYRTSFAQFDHFELADLPGIDLEPYNGSH